MKALIWATSGWSRLLSGWTTKVGGVFGCQFQHQQIRFLQVGFNLSGDSFKAGITNVYGANDCPYFVVFSRSLDDAFRMRSIVGF